MFNPNPHVQTLALGGRPVCHVIDDAQLEPERWIDNMTHADGFPTLNLFTRRRNPA